MYKEVIHRLLPNNLVIVLKCMDSNCLPLSHVILWGVPKREDHVCTNTCATVSAVNISYMYSFRPSSKPINHPYTIPESSHETQRPIMFMCTTLSSSIRNFSINEFLNGLDFCFLYLSDILTASETHAEQAYI